MIILSLCQRTRTHKQTHTDPSYLIYKNIFCTHFQQQLLTATARTHVQNSELNVMPVRSTPAKRKRVGGTMSKEDLEESKQIDEDQEAIDSMQFGEATMNAFFKNSDELPIVKRITREQCILSTGDGHHGTYALHALLICMRIAAYTYMYILHPIYTCVIVLCTQYEMRNDPRYGLRYRCMDTRVSL